MNLVMFTENLVVKMRIEANMQGVYAKDNDLLRWLGLHSSSYELLVDCAVDFTGVGPDDFDCRWNIPVCKVSGVLSGCILD